MADQLLGVLREVVATETKIPRPASSNVFGGDMLSLINTGELSPIKADHHQLPMPMLDSTEPGFNAVLNAGAFADPKMRVTSLTQAVQQFPNSKEPLLRLANSLIDTGNYDKVEQVLAQVEEKDPWDWRVLWYKGRSLMAQGKAQEAQAAFDQVYFDLPGELAPKLGLALAAESAGNFQLATHVRFSLSYRPQLYRRRLWLSTLLVRYSKQKRSSVGVRTSSTNLQLTYTGASRNCTNTD